MTIEHVLSTAIVLTRTCTKNCRFCSFSDNSDNLTAPEDIELLLQKAARADSSEAVFFSGNNPEEFPQIQLKLASYGFASYAEYLLNAGKSALKRGILPTFDIGELSACQLDILSNKDFMFRANVPTATLRGKGEALEMVAGKNISAAERYIELLSEKKLSYSINLYCGIGETAEDFETSLKRIRDLCLTDPYLQEIILTPFQPSQFCEMNDYPPLSPEEFKERFKTAKEIFGSFPISIPPHLFRAFPKLLEHGLSDFSSIYLVGGDPRNPTFHVLAPRTLRTILEQNGSTLRERPPRRKILSNSPQTTQIIKKTDTYNSRKLHLIENGGCFVCSPDNPFGLHIPVKQYVRGNSCSFAWTAPSYLQGYDDIMHGGIIAAISDEAMGYAAMGEGMAMNIVTTDFKLRYIQPVPLGVPLKVEAHITETKRRRVFTECTISLDDGTLLTLATAQFFVMFTDDELLENSQAIATSEISKTNSDSNSHSTHNSAAQNLKKAIGSNNKGGTNTKPAELLANDTCFVCGIENQQGLKLPMKTYTKEHKCSFTWFSKPEYQSYAGFLHGGASALLLDEAMAYAAMGEKPEALYMTAEIKTKYIKPVPTNMLLHVTAEVVKRKMGFSFVESSISLLDGTLLVTGESKFSPLS